MFTETSFSVTALQLLVDTTFVETSIEEMVMTGKLLK